MSTFETLVFGGILTMNVLTFATFGWDKRQAGRGGPRTPEARLLLYSFLTGAPGAWLAMRSFRHKRGKSSFKWRMWAVTILNPLWLLVWLKLREFFGAPS